MTRLWKRLDTDEHCGQCGQPVLRDHPICLLLIPGVKRPLLRCEKCIGPAPDPTATLTTDLAELRKDLP